MSRASSALDQFAWAACRWQGVRSCFAKESFERRTQRSQRRRGHREDNSRELVFVFLVCVLCVSATSAFAFEPDPQVAKESSSPPPISVNYTLKQKGNVVIAIDDADGNRVRNLIADVTREPGAHAEIWDGRDDDGKPVKPGKYQFRGAVLPKPNLTYEFTVNNSGSPPWWKQDVWEPRPDPGGWMSDHAPPLSAAAIGDKVFLGTDAAEHGHSIIAVDLTGRKLWGAKWLELAGSRCICTDGKTVYAAGEGSWIGQHMKLFAIDPQSFAVRRIADLDFGAGPLAGMGGLAGFAARDGKVYASFNPPHQDLATPAFDVNALDLEQTTMPGLQPKHIASLLRLAESDQPWVNLPLDPQKPRAIRIAWKTEQVIGTIVSPHRLEVAALKGGAAYPGSLEKEEDWQPFTASESSSGAMNVYVPAAETRTRSLRVKVLNAVRPMRFAEPQAAVEASGNPADAFVGFRAFRTRIAPVKNAVKVSVSSGQILQDGAWEDKQSADITADAPATYTLTFSTPASISALVVRDPLFATARVEVRSSERDPWMDAGTLHPAFPWRKAYTDAVVDFGRSRIVSALRIVVTEPAVDQNADVKKRTGLARRTCSLGGVLLLDPGGTPEPGQRIAVINADNGQIERDIPIVSPGPLAFEPGGKLLAISGTDVVSVALDSGAPTPVITTSLVAPTGLTCDAKSIFVADSGDHVVKKFSSDGKLIRQIGKPGGIEAGAFDPQHMSRPHGICIDAIGKLWVAEEEVRPKKVSVWDLAGPQPKLDRYFIGGPRYGCGFMFIDPKQPSRFFFEGMEFSVDWKSGTSGVKNITWRAGRDLAWEGVTCDRPIYLNDKLYLVGEPFWFYGNRYFAVAKYVNGKAIPVAAGGKAEDWPPLKDTRIAAKLGNPQLEQFSFLWSDRNDNGLVDPDEVKLSAKDVHLEAAYFGAWAGEDLTLQFTNANFKPTGFTKGGAPLYDFEHMTPMPKLAPGGFGLYNTAMTSSGDFIEISDRVAVHDAKGNLKWSYPDRFNGVHGSMKAPPPQPGMLIGTLHVIGHAKLPELGEVFAVMTNKGEVLVFTTDGLFVARLFEDNRYGKSFNLPKAERGMSLNNISLNAEHFGGTFSQLNDGRIVIVAGHNHNSVIRADGLDQGHRFDGTIEVSEAQARIAALPPKEVARENKRPEPLVVARSAGGSKIDGILDEWKDQKPVELKGTGEHKGRVWLAYDPGALLVAAEVNGTKGMVNHEKDWKLLFRSGDCFDLQLRTAADSTRGDPVAGDLRLLISMYNGEATAVIYRPVVPNTPAKNKSTFASPVASVSFDVVEKLNLPITVTESKTGYTLEAAIPWARLGVKPTAGTRLGGDVGLLFADQAGLATVERIYWSNRNTGLVSDVPGEARLEPKGWGTLELQK